MCGRYGRRGDKQYIAEHYAIRKVDYGDDFPDELQVGIVLAGEVKNGDVAGLPVTIQTTVPLFEPGGIPGDIEVEYESR